MKASQVQVHYNFYVCTIEACSKDKESVFDVMQLVLHDKAIALNSETCFN